MYSIVGREYALSVVNGYLDAALEGSGACILLEGSVGIGKSRMLKTVALEGAERGLAVTYMKAGAGDAAETVRELITFLRHVTWGESPTPPVFHDREFQDLVRPDANPFLLADSLSEMIEEAARRRPLLIILDDAQEIDEVSSVALQGVMRSIASAPVLSLLARRPMPGHSLAQHAIGWLCEHANVHLRLGPLDNEAAAALCADVLGAKPDSSVLAWAARCAGNPWLLERLMGAFMEAGRLAIVDGTASVLAESLPESVTGEIFRLLDVVPPGVRHLLMRGGRVGPRFTVEDAAASPGESFAELSSSVDEAVQSGLVRKVGRELVFVHDVVGEAVQHIASIAAEPIERRPASRPMTPAPACGCEAIAARVSAALGDTYEAPRVMARALCVLAGTGRAADASRFAEIAVRAGMETSAEARLVLDLVPGLRKGGGDEMSAGHLRRTLARRELPESDRAKLEALLEETEDRAGYPIEAEATRHEPDQTRCETCECPSWAGMVRALIAADQFDAAADVVAAIKQMLGEPWAESWWHSHRAELLVAQGRLGEARAAAEAGLGDDAAPAQSAPARATLARISLHQADTDSASQHLRAAEGSVTDEVAAARYTWALALFHAACGRAELAAHTLINANALLFAEVPTAAATLVRLARKAGLGAEAEGAAELARRLGEINPGVASLRGGAEHAQGLLGHDSGALRRAVESYRLSGRPLAVALALEDTATQEHDDHNVAQAVELLGSALDLYVRCDARGDIARVQKKLRRLGVEQAGKHGVPRPTSGWESLTSSELRVVRAIVEGKTNKEAASTLFLSPHTVDSHLRRVFGKLGINTRVELTKHFLTHENHLASIPQSNSSI